MGVCCSSPVAAETPRAASERPATPRAPSPPGEAHDAQSDPPVSEEDMLAALMATSYVGRRLAREGPQREAYIDWLRRGDAGHTPAAPWALTPPPRRRRPPDEIFPPMSAAAGAARGARVGAPEAALPTQSGGS